MSRGWLPRRWHARQGCETSPAPRTRAQEAQARRRWGDTPEYQAYRERTNLLVPLPLKQCAPGKKQ